MKSAAQDLLYLLWSTGIEPIKYFVS